MALADLALTFASSERLPITVSAGIAQYPLHGQAVTSPPAAASVTLDEAKASGGDTVRLADARDEAHDGRFDVLEGLVLAIDTKDHYTRRHSEDVARYAAFIGEQLDLDVETRRSLFAPAAARRRQDRHPRRHPAKPGSLTGGVRERQSAASRIGYRHRGPRPLEDPTDAGGPLPPRALGRPRLPRRLAGEDIPLVARILAVADAFAAMTTTRPYRKALSVQEALRRLEDAAGTEPNAQLVRVFLEGLESAANPPLPGDGAPAILWTPQSVVA